MSGDVEDFLRRLIEKQQAQKPPQRPTPQRAARQRPAQQPRSAATPRQPVPRRLAAEVVEDVEIIDAEPVNQESVARHVATHIDTHEFQTRSGRLGAGVRDEEAALESHFRETFGSGPKGALANTSSSVTDASPGAEAKGPSAASQILGMIASPNDLRRAFILGELLRRPDFDELGR